MVLGSKPERSMLKSLVNVLLATIKPVRTASTSCEVEMTIPQLASVGASVILPPKMAEAKSIEVASAVATFALVVTNVFTSPV